MAVTKDWVRSVEPLLALLREAKREHEFSLGAGSCPKALAGGEERKISATAALMLGMLESMLL